MKLAISLLTCDKPELVAQSCKPLIESAIAGKHHLFVIDGSAKPGNEEAIAKLTYPTGYMIANIRGGAGAAIVYALTMMLNHEENYSHVGLCEADVLLHDGWLAIFDLFSEGEADGLVVGAASARCFTDRVLFQRDGYAVCHNLGAGMVVLSREAAQIILDTFRTGWTTDNRRIFAQLSDHDIGSYWAFRTNEHYLTADWHWDAALAAHGLASLALTPSPVEMIGQNPPLAEQGLTIASGEVATLTGFDQFKDRLQQVRSGSLRLGVPTHFHFNPATGTWTYFPHQMAMLSGQYVGDWRLVERRGWGTFGWKSGEVDSFGPSLVVPVFGSVAVLVSGGKDGGRVLVQDESSGFEATPDLAPEGDQGHVLQIMVPGGSVPRNIRITALTPGIIFYGLQTREQQAYLPHVGFDYSMLPTP